MNHGSSASNMKGDFSADSASATGNQSSGRNGGYHQNNFRSQGNSRNQSDRFHYNRKNQHYGRNRQNARQGTDNAMDSTASNTGSYRGSSQKNNNYGRYNRHDRSDTNWRSPNTESNGLDEFVINDMEQFPSLNDANHNTRNSQREISQPPQNMSSGESYKRNQNDLYRQSNDSFRSHNDNYRSVGDNYNGNRPNFQNRRNGMNYRHNYNANNHFSGNNFSHYQNNFNHQRNNRGGGHQHSPNFNPNNNRVRGNNRRGFDSRRPRGDMYGQNMMDVPRISLPQNPAYQPTAYMIRMPTPPSFPFHSQPIRTFQQYKDFLNIKPEGLDQYLPGESPHDFYESELFKVAQSNNIFTRHENCCCQIEYYFSNANLKNDDFLRSCMNENGWVSLQTIKKFNRISRLGFDIENIIKAVSLSERLEYDGVDKIRRKNEPEKWTESGLQAQIVKFGEEHPTGGRTSNGASSAEAITFDPAVNNIQPYTPDPSAFSTNGSHPRLPQPSTYGFQHQPAFVHYDPNLNMIPVYPNGMNLGAGSMYFDYGFQPPVDYETHFFNPGFVGDNVQFVEPPPPPVQLQRSDLVLGSQHSEKITAAEVNQDVSNLEQQFDKVNIQDAKKTDCKAQESNSLVFDLNMDDATYHKLVEMSKNERRVGVHDSPATLALYKYWSLSLVDKFDRGKYDTFMSYSIEDIKAKKRHGLDSLYKFYGSVLLKPYSSTVDGKQTKITQNNESLFNDLQSKAYIDYQKNGNSSGLEILKKVCDLHKENYPKLNKSVKIAFNVLFNQQHQSGEQSKASPSSEKEVNQLSNLVEGVHLVDGSDRTKKTSKSSKKSAQ